MYVSSAPENGRDLSKLIPDFSPSDSQRLVRCCEGGKGAQELELEDSGSLLQSGFGLEVWPGREVRRSMFPWDV